MLNYNDALNFILYVKPAAQLQFKLRALIMRRNNWTRHHFCVDVKSRRIVRRMFPCKFLELVLFKYVNNLLLPTKVKTEYSRVFGADYMEKFQRGLGFHPVCWRIEKKSIIWIREVWRKAHILTHTLCLLFKLFLSLPYVNSRAEISPCSQPLNGNGHSKMSVTMCLNEQDEIQGLFQYFQGLFSIQRPKTEKVFNNDTDFAYSKFIIL